jgi:hypothetical protein
MGVGHCFLTKVKRICREDTRVQWWSAVRLPSKRGENILWNNSCNNCEFRCTFKMFRKWIEMISKMHCAFIRKFLVHLEIISAEAYQKLTICISFWKIEVRNDNKVKIFYLQFDPQVFENLEWEIECTADVWKALRDKHVLPELKRTWWSFLHKWRVHSPAARCWIFWTILCFNSGRTCLSLKAFHTSAVHSISHSRHILHS